MPRKRRTIQAWWYVLVIRIQGTRGWTVSGASSHPGLLRALQLVREPVSNTCTYIQFLLICLVSSACHKYCSHDCSTAVASSLLLYCGTYCLLCSYDRSPLPESQCCLGKVAGTPKGTPHVTSGLVPVVPPLALPTHVYAGLIPQARRFEGRLGLPLSWILCVSI